MPEEVQKQPLMREMNPEDIGIESEKPSKPEWSDETVAKTLGIEAPGETPEAHEEAMERVRENLERHTRTESANEAGGKKIQESVDRQYNETAPTKVDLASEKVKNEDNRRSAAMGGLVLTAAATLGGLGAAFVGGETVVSALGLDSVVSSLTSFLGETGPASSDAIVLALAGIPAIGGLIATVAVWAGMKLNHMRKERKNGLK